MTDNHKNIIKVFNDKAKLYQERFMDVSHYSSSFNVLTKGLPKNASVLDVACGPANVSVYLLKHRVDLKITGTDLAENMLALAKNNVPAGEFLTKDCRDFSWIDKKYAAIILGFCFPYITKEEAIKMIADAAKNLADGGLLYISTMTDKYENSCYKEASTKDTAPIFMHYHEAGYLIASLQENGLKVVHNEQLLIKDEPIIKDLVLVGKLPPKVS